MQTSIEAAGDTPERQPEPSPGELSRFWQLQLALSDQDNKDWFDYGSSVEQRYKNERENVYRKNRRARRFSILYSNTETIKAALYAKTPKPDVRRRFSDRKPIARMGAEIVERALSYCSDNTEHDRALRRGVHDLAVPGRGVVRLVYEAETDTIEVPGMLGEVTQEDVIVDQRVFEQHVYWKDFRWSPARNWTDVWWIAFRHRMTREDLEANGFEDAAEIPLNWAPDVEDRKGKECPQELKRAEVWEIWDQSRRRRIWIVKGFKKALRVDDDPYGLEDFWPMAEPLSAILSNDSFVPCAYYAQYEDQAADLDEITGRISILTKALKRRGVYDGSVEELKRLARAQDNEFIPVKSYASLVQAGGLAKAFESEDIKTVADVLVGLYQQRDQLVQGIYEVTGISDIMRGATNANETATAQSIKAQFGSNRMRDAQAEVQRWVRDTYRIKAELIVENFEPQIIAQMTGLDMSPEFEAAIQMLRQDKLRGYAIDIETDSTVFEDAEAEKESRVELLTAMSQFMGNMLPVVQQAPPIAPLVFEMLAFGVRGFKAGRQIEDTLDDTLQQIMQQMQQAQQQPEGPDPEAQALEAEAAREQQRFELEMQGKQMDTQAKVIDLQVHQAKAATDMEKAQLDLERAKQTEGGPNGA